MSSQYYWPISTFWSPPRLSGSPGWYSSLSGTWYNCLKVKTVIWSFAIKQSMLFLHFWQKWWPLTSCHTTCIVFHPAFALHYPLAAFRANVLQSALSSCALGSWARLGPQCWAPGIQHWVFASRIHPITTKETLQGWALCSDCILH